jgi:hypothetical protein
MPNIEFGKPLATFERAKTCAELIRNTIKFTFKNDSIWEEDKVFFPEYAEKIENIKNAIQRRRKSIEEVTPGKSIVRQISDEAGFADPIGADILMNRLYPNDLPETIDSKEKEKVKKEALLMVKEAGEEIRTFQSVEFMTLVLFSDLRLTPLGKDHVNGQLPLNLTKRRNT